MIPLEEYRRLKDQFFKNSPNSPLREEDKSRFKGLDYFEENPNLRFILDLKPTEQKPVEITTSDNDKRISVSYTHLTLPTNREV